MTFSFGMKSFLFALALVFSFSPIASAQDFKKGLEAYNRGDFKGAVEEWWPLAQKGKRRAQRNIALMFQRGEGVPKSSEQAAWWFLQAAKQGDLTAQFAVSSYYLSGTGLPKSEYESFKWAKKAATAGDARAQWLVGQHYHAGWGVSMDLVEAFNWYKKSAEQGNYDGLQSVGRMYFFGTGVPQDNTEAYIFFSLAAAAGHEDGGRFRDEAARRMTPEARRSAEREAAKRWKRIQRRKK